MYDLVRLTKRNFRLRVAQSFRFFGFANFSSWPLFRSDRYSVGRQSHVANVYRVRRIASASICAKKKEGKQWTRNRCEYELLLLLRARLLTFGGRSLKNRTYVFATVLRRIRSDRPRLRYACIIDVVAFLDTCTGQKDTSVETESFFKAT